MSGPGQEAAPGAGAPALRRRSVLESALTRLRAAVLEMGELVDTAIARSTTALVTRDVELCAAVIEGDEEVNRLHREVRELAFTAIVTQAPVAHDLREIMSELHMAYELERMGDHCVSIAKIGRNLANMAPARAGDLPAMSARISEQVRDMLSAMVARDVGAARAVAERDDRVDRLYHRLFDDLIQPLTALSDEAFAVAGLLFVAHHLERIGDRVTNLAEDLVYSETGEIRDLG